MSIWQYDKYFTPPVEEKYRITLNEGLTPLYEIGTLLSKKLGGVKPASVFAKIERENPTGTHKDRSFAYWVSLLRKQDIGRAVITSSGNSARSAREYCKKAGIELEVFTKEVSRTPKRDAFVFARDSGAYFLRSSIDDASLEGYKTIAYELAEQAPHTEILLVPTSSGSTAQGIYLGYMQLKAVGAIDSPPRIFIVQTASVFPIAGEFDSPPALRERSSLASSIVDRIAHRKRAVIELVRESGGGGVVVSNAELYWAQEVLKDWAPGWESLLTVAALKKLKEADGQKVICLFTS